MTEHGQITLRPELNLPLLYNIDRGMIYMYIFSENRKDETRFRRQFAPMVLNIAYGVDTFFVLR